MHTCIYFTSALLFFSSFLTSSNLLGRLADSDPSCRTHSPQPACPSRIPQARALLACLPADMALLGHYLLVLLSQKLSVAGLNGRVAPSAGTVLVLTSATLLGGFVVHAFAVTTKMLVTPPQPRAASRPQRLNTPMICSPGIPAFLAVSPFGSLAIVVQLAGSSSQIFSSSFFPLSV